MVALGIVPTAAWNDQIGKREAGFLIIDANSQIHFAGSLPIMIN